MTRSVLAVSLVFFSSLVLAQNRASDAQALALATKSIAALTSGIAVKDVTLAANVTSIAGSDYLTGTAALKAKGVTESRVELNLGDVAQSESRGLNAGVPGGSWTKTDTATANLRPKVHAAHNCRTDAVWFFPALSSLTQTSNPNFVFSYIGREQHNGVAAEHIRIFQSASGDSLSRHLSTMDFFLDPVSMLPLSISFQIHPDNDAGTDIPTEIRFANYQAVNGVQVPYHIQRIVNGGVVLDAVVTSAVFNTGFPNITFSLQ